MPAGESLEARIQRLLDAGDAIGAVDSANRILAASPFNFAGLFGRARGALRLGDHIAARRDLRAALLLNPNHPEANLIQANLDMQAGHTEKALSGMRKIAGGRTKHAVEATLNLLEALHTAGRTDEHSEIVRKGGDWTKDERTPLHVARARFREDPEAGLAEYVRHFHSNAHPTLRRWSGFEAVGHLDKMGRYREAFDLATEIHHATTGPADLRPILELAEIQLRLLERKPMPFVARAEPIPNLAFIVSMPRSGTTLLEQMLDRHASIGGIGEYDGLDHVCATLTETPGWLTNPQEVPQNLIDKLRHGYVGGIDRIRRPGATHTVDKSLRCWRALPEIATVFPGAVAISIDRDPRDVATSLFLHYFNPSTYEWTSAFDTIRQVIETQRKIVEVALEILEIPSERIVYEDLVEDPAAESARVLQRMGLGMDDAVLSPENNPKGAATLSYEQVRKPINRGSIGRWKNYAWAFDSSWDRIVDEHNSRRTRSTP